MRIEDNYDLLQYLIDKRLGLHEKHHCLHLIESLIEWATNRLDEEVQGE